MKSKNNQNNHKNKLKSIKHDAEFIKKAARKFSNLPVIPNKRTGLYYIHPSKYSSTCYFKSTDGHFNNWDISLKRLNLHLLNILHSQNGILIVDATKRGKTFPDSMTKTIPIWCALINKLVKNHNISIGIPCDWDTGFKSSNNWVSQSEAHQINLILPKLFAKLKVTIINYSRLIWIYKLFQIY